MTMALNLCGFRLWGFVVVAEFVDFIYLSSAILNNGETNLFGAIKKKIEREISVVFASSI